MYKINNRVKSNGRSNMVPKGRIGTVALAQPNRGLNLSVRWDDVILGGHTCNLNIKDGYGYWMRETEVELIEE